MATGETKVKTGVVKGGGEPPGYMWNCLFLNVARREAMEHLDEAQYHHVADQFKEMAMQVDPIRAPGVDVQRIEDFFELRDKGGPLRKLNIRVYFAVYGGKRSDIVVLGTTKKEADGKTPYHDIVRMRRRKRAFEASTP